MKKEYFNRNGKVFVTLDETNDGVVITQVWQYRSGKRRSNVRLVNPDMDGAIDVLMAAHRKICAEPGMRSAGNEEPSSPWMVMHAENCI